MITAWTKHISDPDEKQRFQSAVEGSKIVLQRMSALLDEEEKDLERTENDYNNPNWDYRQADANGYRRCLRKIKKLITLDQGNQ